jgi:hypothetical protein
MDIFAFIEKLQKKPEASRKKILLAIVFAIMGVIIAVWLTTFNLPKTNSAEIKKVAAPFSSVKEDILNFYGFFKENLKRFK